MNLPNLINWTQLWWKSPGWMPFWKIHEPQGIIDQRLPTVEQLRVDAAHLRSILHPVIHNDKYLSIYRMNMDDECPLWARSNLCTNGNACTIETCDGDDVPDTCKEENIVKMDENVYDPWIQLEAVQKYSGQLDMSTFSEFETEKDSNEQFYDLSVNTPGNTNYRGKSLWGYIYENNCLHSGKFPQSDEASFCTEEGAYFKMISGIQTVIATLNAEHSDDKGMIPFNLSYFKNAVSWNESWISNLYFTYGMLQRSACKIAPLLEQIQCPNQQGQPEKICDSLVQFLESTSESCKALETMPEFMFQSLAVNAVQKLQEMSSIMDCVECEKCRLHAKVKINALQTVVKATSPQGVVSMERNEIVAFLHALDYFAEGIEILAKFQSRLQLITWTFGAVLGACILVIRLVFYRIRSRRTIVSEAKKQE